MFKHPFIVLFCFIPYVVSAGGENGTGAKSQAFGNASSTLSDPYSLFNNTAGLADVKNYYLISGYHLPFLMTDLQSVYAGFVMPMKDFGTGISFHRWGTNWYNETTAGIGVAHTIRAMSIGCKVNYVQTAISEMKTRRNMVLELGGIMQFTRHLKAGAHIYNFNLAKHGNESLPIAMKAGFAILPSDHFTIVVEAEKRNYSSPSIKSGIEYVIDKKFFLRTGISTGVLRNYFGAGIQSRFLQFDYALSTHPYLGVSHTLSLVYLLKK